MAKRLDVAVVGGGLGGLAVAALSARRGLDVAVLERSNSLGGRAATHRQSGFDFNLGAHALYRGGPAQRVLGELGVTWTGGEPPTRGLAFAGGRAFALPSTPATFLTTGLLGWGAKLEQARLVGRLRAIDTEALASVPLSEWLGREVADPTLRAVLEMFVRLTTFANAPERVSAGAAIGQLRRAQKHGVAYLDGGWQTLVDGAERAAVATGVSITKGVHVTRAECGEGGWTLACGDGSTVRACSVVVAAGPSVAAGLLASPELEAYARQATPQRIACLDVGLRRPSRPSRPDRAAAFALAVDRPLYLSVHSSTARLAPEGAALVSTMKYLSTEEGPDAARDEAELEAWLDVTRPGWRDVVVVRRFLPAMVATHALVSAVSGGLAGRPDVAVAGAPGAFIVGDWVGPEGLLLDGVLASAERAASQLVARLATPEPAPQARVA